MIITQHKIYVQKDVILVPSTYNIKGYNQLFTICYGDCMAEDVIAWSNFSGSKFEDTLILGNLFVTGDVKLLKNFHVNLELNFI